jgi:hypothetical protein
MNRDLFSTFVFLDYEALVKLTFSDIPHDDTNVACVRNFYNKHFLNTQNLRKIISDYKLCVQSSNVKVPGYSYSRRKRELTVTRDLRYYDDFEDRRVQLLKAYKCTDFLPPGLSMSPDEIRKSNTYLYCDSCRKSIDCILACTELGYFNSIIEYINLDSMNNGILYQNLPITHLVRSAGTLT